MQKELKSELLSTLSVGVGVPALVIYFFVITTYEIDLVWKTILFILVFTVLISGAVIGHRLNWKKSDELQQKIQLQTYSFVTWVTFSGLMFYGYLQLIFDEMPPLNGLSVVMFMWALTTITFAVNNRRYK